MTLIVPSRNDSVSGSDDGDSGCLPESPEDGKNIMKGERMKKICSSPEEHNIKRKSDVLDNDGSSVKPHCSMVDDNDGNSDSVNGNSVENAEKDINLNNGKECIESVNFCVAENLVIKEIQEIKVDDRSSSNDNESVSDNEDCSQKNCLNSVCITSTPTVYSIKRIKEIKTRRCTSLDNSFYKTDFNNLIKSQESSLNSSPVKRNINENKSSSDIEAAKLRIHNLRQSFLSSLSHEERYDNALTENIKNAKENANRFNDIKCIDSESKKDEGYGTQSFSESRHIHRKFNGSFRNDINSKRSYMRTSSLEEPLNPRRFSGGFEKNFLLDNVQNLTITDSLCKEYSERSDGFIDNRPISGNGFCIPKQIKKSSQPHIVIPRSSSPQSINSRVSFIPIEQSSDERNVLTTSYVPLTPPDRLENWKNILAEKRHSLKSQLIQRARSTEEPVGSNSNAQCINKCPSAPVKDNTSVYEYPLNSTHNDARNQLLADCNQRRISSFEGTILPPTSSGEIHIAQKLTCENIKKLGTFVESFVQKDKLHQLNKDEPKLPLQYAKKTSHPEPQIVEVISNNDVTHSPERKKSGYTRQFATQNLITNGFSKYELIKEEVCPKSPITIRTPEKKSDFSDSDFELKRKFKLQEACQNVARALHTIPPPLDNNFNRDNKINSLSNDSTIKTVRDKKDKIKHAGIQTRNKHKKSEKKKRNSSYDNCIHKHSCECGEIHSSDDSDLNRSINSTNGHSSRPVRFKRAKRKKSDQKNGKIVKCISIAEEKETVISDSDITNDSDFDDDYCQTEDCGDDCDYYSGDDAEDEEETPCSLCRKNRSLSPVCKHSHVITNGLLKTSPVHGKSYNSRMHGPKSTVLQAVLRRQHVAHIELSSIREYGLTSDDQLDSEEDQISCDGSNCDISSSWRYGLSHDSPTSNDSTLKSDISSSSLPTAQTLLLIKEKSNSLPGANMRPHLHDGVKARPNSSVTLRQTSTSEDETSSFGSGPKLPPRPPRQGKLRSIFFSSPSSSGNTLPAMSTSPKPTMGLQGLQQQRSPNMTRGLHVSGLPVAPRTVAPRSPSNPNPPYGFPAAPSPPLLCPGSPSTRLKAEPATTDVAPASPKVSSRAGALVTRNFSISDDECGQRLSRRQVTITRHESVYKEAAEKGYPLPPGSPVDPYWLTWKLGVLQKTIEDVGARLEEAEKAVGTWGQIPQDPNLADQYIHNVRKYRETLTELQRGIDDVNDQAARFNAHNVPLSKSNSTTLQDLNNRWKNLESTVNDRWRQVAGRSRDVTPLTPAQLASSVNPPWERATANNKVPYYINHAQETTHWDHPQMVGLLDSLSDLNHIKFSAYRTATKLRTLQKKLALDQAKLQTVTDVFDEHGLRGQNDRLIDVNDMVVVLSTLYGRISIDRPDLDTTLTTDLCLNWLLNVYDSQRTGQMRVLSFRVGLISLCRGHLEEKYRYMFRLIADPNRLTDQRKLGLLLHDCIQIPRQLGEVAAFGGSNIEPSVRSCFTKAGKDRETIEAVHFLTWVQQEPQSLVWLAVLHRVAASETVQHQVKCNICKTYPILGLRYRCLKCLSFDMCQQCFFEGRSGKTHKITHPMHEYCTATTAGDEMKDFTKALKNKFKSKRSLQKHTKKGYLPVQTVLEGDPLESPSPSPQHMSSNDMHNRLELYASRLAEVELRTNSNSTPDSEDEHGLIAQYCQSLSSSDALLPVPRSPLQIMASVDAEQKDELEQMIKDLEEENKVLQAEYDRLKSQQPVGSPPDDTLGVQRSEAEMLAEAKLLRQHKGRLEARMGILEEHNRQLETQLLRLRQLLDEQQGGNSSPNKSGTLQTKSVTASQLAMDSPAKINGHSNQGGASSVYDELDQMAEYVRPPPPPMGNVAHVGNLFSRAGDLGTVVGNLVATMSLDQENGLRNQQEDDSREEE